MLLILCLMLLTACSGSNALRPPEIHKQYPPAAWTQDCPAPVYVPGQGWIFVAEYADALEETARCDRCDKQRLRAWRQGYADPPASMTPDCPVSNEPDHGTSSSQ